jgi:hypothetical protein
MVEQLAGVDQQLIVGLYFPHALAALQPLQPVLSKDADTPARR